MKLAAVIFTVLTLLITYLAKKHLQIPFNNVHCYEYFINLAQQ